MSKQSDAKKEQNYREAHDTCANCGHYRSQMVEKSYDVWSGKQTWTEEKGKRCAIGGFAVKKMATCDRHVLLTPFAKAQDEFNEEQAKNGGMPYGTYGGF